MYAGAILDLDGTVYRGDALLAGAREGIETLRAAGIDVLFLSNKAIHRVDRYVELLSELGVSATPADVINSSAITADYLASHHPDRTFLVVGEPPLLAELTDAGLSVSDEPKSADALVVSMDRRFDYETLADAAAVLSGADVPYFATNADATCPVPGGEIPDAGGIIGAIEGVTGRSPDRVLGKPSRVAVDVATDRLDAAPEECLMVGDRLETDILMGERAGMTSVLVLTGVADGEEVGDGLPTPDHVIDSLADVGSVIDG